MKKKDGGVYEPSSLTSFQRSIQRYLKDKNSTFNLFQDAEFAKSREVLLAKKRELVKKYAKGNRPQAGRSITPTEEHLLFRINQFGDHNPEALCSEDVVASQPAIKKKRVAIISDDSDSD